MARRKRYKSDSSRKWTGKSYRKGGKLIKNVRDRDKVRHEES